MSKLTELQQELQQLADPRQKDILQRFFKTGKGEYGEGDIFLGIKVPVQRKVAKKYGELSLAEISVLLQNPLHEYRLTALLLLIHQYSKAETPTVKQQIVEFYLANTSSINNWDLVDLSAPAILGAYLLEKPKLRQTLYTLARSENLWERRIAMVATLTFIKNQEFDDTLKLAKILLHDDHDLIHKAVGWMLREVGKRNQQLLEDFLNQYSPQMPRTMLRYAIEKLEDSKRQFYLR
jgi:3-methyladenine DNA glycosylase AlkD